MPAPRKTSSDQPLSSYPLNYILVFYSTLFRHLLSSSLAALVRPSFAPFSYEFTVSAPHSYQHYNLDDQHYILAYQQYYPFECG